MGSSHYLSYISQDFSRSACLWPRHDHSSYLSRQLASYPLSLVVTRTSYMTMLVKITLASTMITKLVTTMTSSTSLWKTSSASWPLSNRIHFSSQLSIIPMMRPSPSSVLPVLLSVSISVVYFHLICLDVSCAHCHGGSECRIPFFWRNLWL